MATRKPTPRKTSAARSPSGADAPSTLEGLGSAMSTMSGPSMPTLDTERLSELPEAAQRAAGRYAGTQALAAAMPYNALKEGEHGLKAGHAPQPGTPVQPRDEADTGSTLSEDNESAKLGDGMARTGFNPTNDSLDRVRVDSGGQPLA